MPDRRSVASAVRRDLAAGLRGLRPAAGEPPAAPDPWSRAAAGRARRREAVLRRAVPALGLLLVAVLTADLVALHELESRVRPEPLSVAARNVPVRIDDRYVAEPAPAHSAPPAVAPLGELREPHLFVAAPAPLSPQDVARVRAVAGVAAVEQAGAAEVMLDGKRVRTLGVDPSTFRAYTPRATAGSDELWRNIAGGDAAVSFVLGKDGGVALGSIVDAGGVRLRVGAYATMGIGAIDAVVSRETARVLGIPEGNALVVSAPKVDSAKLRRRLLKVLPKGSQVATINPVLVAPERRGAKGGGGGGTGAVHWPASAFMSPEQIRTALTAAVGKIGRPYVWGAEGPDSFDCSGLVQWAYAQAGVRMPRVTHQQWVTGPQVPLDQARPGDLIFWRHDPTNPGYISHVAIYWGDGKMLHAPRTGDVVKIAPITTRNLAGVVRVSPAVAARVR